MLLTEKGEEIEGPAEGILAIKGAWPSMFRDLYNNHERYEETYFSPFKARPEDLVVCCTLLQQCMSEGRTSRAHVVQHQSQHSCADTAATHAG